MLRARTYFGRLLHLRYSEDQERDEGGRFADMGGGGSSSDGESDSGGGGGSSQKDWEDGLSKAEKTAFRHWGEDVNVSAKDAAAIDSAISRAPAHVGTVFRGFEGDPNPKVGSTVTFKRLTATSKDQEVAENHLPVQEKTSTLYRIKLTGKAAAADIQNLVPGAFMGEAEVLMKKGQKFKVKRSRMATAKDFKGSGGKYMGKVRIVDLTD